MPPFIIFALPRSRTFQLSRAMSYGAWACWHEEFPKFRTLDDLKAWLSQDFTGASETTAAPIWRAVLNIRPDTRALVVRRPVDEVVDSLMRLDMRGVCTFDRDKLTDAMAKLDRKLDQIEARMPNALSVRYDDLSSAETGARIFEHCLGLPFDAAWWAKMSAQNLQADMPAMMRYMVANAAALDKFARIVRWRTATDLMPRKMVNRDDVTIQQESCDVWYRDGKRLFEEHSIQLGEAPDDYTKRNWKLMRTMDSVGAMQIMTARCNGRMVGYYVCYVAPATNDASLTSALHISIYASKDVPGIGTRLQRASIAALREKGVGEVCFRAGVLADGARMGPIYERAGAEYIGKMYRLDMRSS